MSAHARARARAKGRDGGHGQGATRATRARTTMRDGMVVDDGARDGERGCAREKKDAGETMPARDKSERDGGRSEGERD